MKQRFLKKSKYLTQFLWAFSLYFVVILILSQQGQAKFEHLHLVVDVSNAILSILLTLLLMGELYKISSDVRKYLAIGFGLTALSEILHALVDIEWSGSFEWIQVYSLLIRPATWPPTTYILPISLIWLYWSEHKRIPLRASIFAAGMLIITIALFELAWVLPKYVDTGILGIQRPTQVPVLFIWIPIIIACWLNRAKAPVYEGLAWLGVMLLISDGFMLFSTSPHEKFTMIAHIGKLFGYMLLHIIMMRASSEDSLARRVAEANLRIAAIAFESQEGILVSDNNNVILRVNQAFTDISGYSAEEVVGKNPRILSSGRQDSSFYFSMWKSIGEKGSWAGEIWNRRKNGEIYPEFLTITAVKDVDGAITNYVSTSTDITLSKQAQDEIQHLAFYDPLTRLPNRRLLIDRLNQALASSIRSGKDGAILFLDIDHFKTLNDSLGHDVGDQLLKQVAVRLTLAVRDGDTVARLGGDEFIIMLEDLSESALEAAAQTEEISEKIITSLNQPYYLAKHEYHCTSSIGIALFSGHEQSHEELLKHADIAMYQAKKAGRNTVQFFDPKMQQAIHTRIDLERELRKALELHQFHLYYQVQVDISERILGAEALIRWIHPERGLISPFHFIPLAEETGLILPIGQWVLESACTQLKKWELDPVKHDLTISINVSAKQFYQPDFVEQVLANVDRYQIDPLKLKLELTESMLLDNVEDTIVKMNALKERGIRFSLDDFGTGYSSLQYLKRLPLAQLKIDQSFVRDIGTDSSDQEIVHTIIAMAHSLHLDVIAEGVETNEQLGFLVNNACLHYQGYMFGKPEPIEEFEASLCKTDCSLSSLSS